MIEPDLIKLDRSEASVVVRIMLTFDQAADDFLGDCERRGFRPRSVTTYRRTYTQFADRLPAQTDVSKITTDDIRRYLNSKNKLAPGTRAGIESHLAALFHWLIVQEKIAKNPMLPLHRTRRIASEDLDVTTVSTEEVKLMLAAAQGWTERLCLGVLVFTGVRRHAASTLRLRDYDELHRRLRFREKGGKTIWKPVPDELDNLIRAAIAAGCYADEDYLIPNPGPRPHIARSGERDDRFIWRTVKDVAERAGVKCHTHALRAAFAVFYLETHQRDTLALQSLMGHKSPATTQIYLRKLDRQAEMERVRDLSWGVPVGSEDSRPSGKQDLGDGVSAGYPKKAGAEAASVPASDNAAVPEGGNDDVVALDAGRGGGDVLADRAGVGGDRQAHSLDPIRGIDGLVSNADENHVLDPSEYVYFIAPESRATVKIGYAGDPLARLRDLQTHHPEKLELLLALPGDMKREHALHDRFAADRLRGEWFALSATIQAFVAKHGNDDNAIRHQNAEKTFAESPLMGAGGFEPPKRDSGTTKRRTANVEIGAPEERLEQAVPQSPVEREIIVLQGAEAEAFAARERLTKRGLDAETCLRLVGLTEGEGHFGVVRVSQKKNSWRCLFVIKLRADDRPLLEDIWRSVGLGRLREVPDDRYHPCVRWEVEKKEEVDQLADVFRAYPLRSKKARDVAIWMEAIDEWAIIGKGDRGTDWSRMEQLARDLREVRKFNLTKDDLALLAEQAASEDEKERV